ncbi:four helix bundle protein [Candidatus Uhrbacteria bacterium]|nr:four helix bundle protein [Candidatus Uhrbacteria bacterium]
MNTIVPLGTKKYLQLNDIDAYKVAFQLSNEVWDIVMRWDHFAKDAVGKQWARAVDSISANIAEGFGRYTKKDKINFYRYSYGSIKESLDWNEKARVRGLISTEQYQRTYAALQQLPRLVNQLIQFTNDRLQQ